MEGEGEEIRTLMGEDFNAKMERKGGSSGINRGKKGGRGEQKEIEE